MKLANNCYCYPSTEHPSLVQPNLWTQLPENVRLKPECHVSEMKTGYRTIGTATGEGSRGVLCKGSIILWIMDFSKQHYILRWHSTCGIIYNLSPIPVGIKYGS